MKSKINYLNLFFKTTSIFTLVVSICLFFIFHLSPYENFIQFVLDYFPVAERERLIELIPKQSYRLFKFATVLLFLPAIILFFFSKKISLSMREVIKGSQASLKKFLYSLDKRTTYYFIGIFLLAIVCRMFLIVFMPIRYDEAWTYLFFTRQGVLSSASFYPVPNNHVLHSLLTNITYYFPFEKTINLRLPNLFVNLLSIGFSFYILSKKFNSKNSLILTLIYTCLFPVLYFGFSSRGYSITILAFMLCFYCLDRILGSTKDSKLFIYHFYFSLGTITGFYALPAFLYPYVSLALFASIYTLWHRKIMILGQIVLNGIISGIIILLLYTPIFLVSGISSITNNRFVESIPRAEVIRNSYSYFSDAFYFITGLSFYLFIVLLIPFLYSFFYKKKNITLTLSVFCFLICPILIIIHSVCPPFRIWSYLSFPFILSLGYLFSFIKRERAATLIVPTALYLILLSFFSHSEIKRREQLSFDSYSLSEFIKEKGYKSAYIYHPFIKTNLSYHFEGVKQPSFTFTHQDLISIDSLNDVNDYDIIISSTLLKSEDTYTLIQDFGSDIILYEKINK